MFISNVAGGVKIVVKNSVLWFFLSGSRYLPLLSQKGHHSLPYKLQVTASAHLNRKAILA